MVPNIEPPIVTVTSANGCAQKRCASLQQNLREGGPSSRRSLLQLDVASAASRFPPPGRSAALALALVRLSFTPQINKNARISFFFPPSSLASCLACVNSQILVQAALAICSHR